MKNICYLFLMVLVTLSLNAEAKSDKVLDEKFTSMLLAGDATGWSQLIQQLQRQQLSSEEMESVHLAQYSLMAYYMANEELFKAKKIISVFDEQLKTLDTNANATLMAYCASISGFQIALNPTKAFSLATTNKSNISRALQLEPQNTTALFEKANALFFTPEKHGGDQRKALGVYETCFRLHQKKTERNLDYFCAGAWLVRVYYHFDMLPEAREVCETLLKEAPDFLLIKEEYLPIIKQAQFDKKWEIFLEEAGDD